MLQFFIASVSGYLPYNISVFFSFFHLSKDFDIISFLIIFFLLCWEIFDWGFLPGFFLEFLFSPLFFCPSCSPS